MSETSRPDPAPLMRLSTAYWESQTFLTAVRMGVFEILGDGAMTARDMAVKLDGSTRHVRLFLNALAGLELLAVDGDTYRNTPATQVFLVPGTPAYMGNAFRYSDDLYATWGDLETTVRTGAPALAEQTYLGADEAQTRHFVHGMHNRALAIGQALVGLVDLDGAATLLDVGGGPGTYSAMLAMRYPNLRCRVLELPDVAAIGQDIVASMGVGDRVEFIPGSHVDTAFPGGNDAVLISGVLHREEEAGCRRLIEQSVASLNPGGQLIVADVMTDAGGCTPAFPALFGVNMMLTAPSGGVHADADMARWMEDAGLAGTQANAFPPPMPHRVVTGLAPAGQGGQ